MVAKFTYLYIEILDDFLILSVVQSAGVAEYTDCISAEG